MSGASIEMIMTRHMTDKIPTELQFILEDGRSCAACSLNPRRMLQTLSSTPDHNI